MLDQLDEDDRTDLPKGRSGLNHQPHSSGSSGISHFGISKAWTDSMKTQAGTRSGLNDCNVKMIYESVLAQYFVTICISPVLPTTKKILPPHTQEKSI